MNHEEITREIELPSKGKNNIIHVNFSPRAVRGPRSRNTGPAGGPPPWMRELDVREPWILRLMAVIAILILSMLIL